LQAEGEAIQESQAGVWIASELTLLAKTSQILDRLV